MRFKKKAQEQGPVATIIIIIVTIVILFLWLGQFNNNIMQNAIVEADLSGVEAFGIANFNLWVWIFLLIGVIAFLTLGGGKK